MPESGEASAFTRKSSPQGQGFHIMTSKVWFITGSSKGFGRVWAEAALARGDSVAATARDAATLADLVEKYGDKAEELTRHGRTIRRKVELYADLDNEGSENEDDFGSSCQFGMKKRRKKHNKKGLLQRHSSFVR